MQVLKPFYHFQRQWGPLQLEATGFPAISLYLTKAISYFLTICFLLPLITPEVLFFGILQYLGILHKFNFIKRFRDALVSSSCYCEQTTTSDHVDATASSQS